MEPYQPDKNLIGTFVKQIISESCLVDTRIFEFTAIEFVYACLKSLKKQVGRIKRSFLCFILLVKILGPTKIVQSESRSLFLVSLDPDFISVSLDPDTDICSV